MNAFQYLFEPRSIAVVGVSEDAVRPASQAVHALMRNGYSGKIYPVNPKYEEMQGLKCYPDVRSVPRPCDVALVVVSGQHVPDVIEQCGEVGIGYAVVLSAGFDEIGERGRELQQKLDAAIAKSGVRVIGPNCVGLANMRTKACCAFGGALGDPSLEPGPMAVVSQSGGIGLGMIAHAQAHGIGTTFFVSSGNEADLTALDIIELLIRRGATVTYSDMWVPSFDHGGHAMTEVPFEKAIAADYDCAVIATDHAAFDYENIAKMPLVVDTRNALKGVTGPNIFKL